MKKVLAWAVALALVLSSFTMAFAADTKTSADFKDASSINYTEAVDVMVATGIINGYPDGTFGPQKTVKRAEMAKMIAVMMNGGEDIGDQFKGACPFKDSKDHWAAGYIAYCASEHIIDGRSADVFDPEAQVTGTEVAKMALTSLGYDSKIQGYTGENWAAAVLKDAKKNDLFDGLMDSFVPGNPCDRESAAQILFNCLKATEVEYDNSTSVKVGDAEVTVNSKVQPVTKNGETVELYEDVFGGDLTQKPSTTTDGKKAHKWFYEKKEIGEYPDEADETAVADEKTTAGDMAKDVEKDAKVSSVTLNGDVQEGADPAKFDILVGDKVEMFENGTDEKGNTIYDLIVTRYQLAKIGEVDTDVTSKDAEDDITAYVYINGEKYNDTDVVGFDAATYEDDVYLAVAIKASDKSILDSYVADTEQGEIEKKAKDSITVKGTASTASGNYAAGVNKETESVAWKDLKVKDSVYDVYFDAEGYVLGAVVFEESEDLYAVLTAEASGSGFDKDKKQVKLMDETLAETVYDLSAKVTTVPPIEAAYNGVLVKYELNDNNKIKTLVDESKVLPAGEVTKRGTIGGQILAEDVVAFYYDAAEDPDEDGEWVAYKYDDLLEATIPADTKYVANKDGEVAYILLKEDIADNSEDTVLGFYVGAEYVDNGDGDQYNVTVLVKGSEEVYTTAKDADLKGFTVLSGVDPADATEPTLIKLVLNGDGDAKSVATVNPTPAAEPTDKFAEKVDALEFTNDGDITKVSNKNLIFKGTDAYTYVGDATIYRIKVDADGNYDGLAKFSGKFAEGGAAVVYQLDEDSEAWDAVVYITPADRTAWKGAVAPFAPTGNVEE